MPDAPHLSFPPGHGRAFAMPFPGGGRPPGARDFLRRLGPGERSAASPGKEVMEFRSALPATTAGTGHVHFGKKERILGSLASTPATLEVCLEIRFQASLEAFDWAHAKLLAGATGLAGDSIFF